MKDVSDSEFKGRPGHLDFDHPAQASALDIECLREIAGY